MSDQTIYSVLTFDARGRRAAEGVAPAVAAGGDLYDKDANLVNWAVTPYDDPGAFTQTFSQDEIASGEAAISKDYIRAAQVVYGLFEDGDDKFDKPYEQLTQEEREELVEYGRDRVSNIEDNLTTALLSKLDLNNASPEQFLALHYLMESRRNVDFDIGSVRRMAVGILTDPISIGVGAASFFGLSKVPIPAFRGAGAQATAAGQTTLRAAIANGVKQYGARAVASGAIEGAFYTGVLNESEQAIRTQNYRLDDFSWSENASMMGTGAVFGGVLGGGFVVGAPVAGRVARPIGTHVISPVWRASRQGAGAAANRIGARFSRGFQGFNIQSLRRQPPLPPNALPEYKNGQNWFSLMLKRSWNPYKLFTNWVPSRISAPTDPTPVLRPIINQVDETMNNHGLVDAIRGLQDDMDGFAQALKSNPSQRTTIMQQVDDRIAQFSRDHGTDLTSFENEIANLRSHISDTFVTKDEYRAMHGLADDAPVPTDRDYVFDINDGRYSGLVHIKDTKGNIIFSTRDALLDYLDDMRSVAQNLRDPDFGIEGERIRNLANITEPSSTAKELSNALNKITELASGSFKRLDTTSKHSWQETQILERTLAEGYYNPHSPPTKAADTNLEHVWQQLEEMYTKLKNDKGEVEWSVPKRDDFIREFTEFYDKGFGHEAVYTIRMLRMRRGDAGIQTYPQELMDRLTKDARYGTNQHYTAWADRVRQAGTLADVPGHRLLPTSKGRNAEKFYAEQSYFFRFARRYPGSSFLSTPAKIYLGRDKIAYSLIRGGYYFLGAAKTDMSGTGYIKVKPVWSSHKDGGNWGFFNNPVRRSLTRIASGGLLSKPGYYTAGVGGGMILAGKGLEFATDQATDGEYSTDLGLTTIGKAPLWVGLTVADALTRFTWGQAPFLPDHPYADLKHYLLREDITEEQARRALADFTLVNGEVQPITEGARSLDRHPSATAVIEHLADKDKEPTRENIQAAFAEFGGGSVAAPAAATDGGGDRSRESGGGGRSRESGGSDRSRESGGGGRSRESGGGGRSREQQGEGARSPYTERFNKRNGDEWIAAGGNVAGSVVGGAFDWDGDGKVGGALGQAGTFLSGGAQALFGFFGDMASGRIAGGQTWAAAGIGIIGGLLGANILKGIIPGGDKIPFLGLILFGLIAGYGGKFAYQMMTGQGSGMFKPKGSGKTDRIGHGGGGLEERHDPREPIVVANNTPNSGDNLVAVDNVDGEWGLQVNAGEKTFAPDNFRQMTQSEIDADGAAIIASATNDNSIVPEGWLPEDADEADEWRYDAVNHGGNSMIVLQHTNAPSGAPSHYVLDIDG